MNWWARFELELMLDSIDRSRRNLISLPAEEPEARPGLRRRIAEALVTLGLRLDAEALHSAGRTVEGAPRLNRSDA